MMKRSFVLAALAVVGLFTVVGEVSATTLEYQTLIQANASLAHHYSFDGASEAIRLEDKKGSADMNLSVGTSLPGLGGAGFDGTSFAADFNGTDQRIKTADTAVTLDPVSFTSEVIVRIDAADTAGQYIFHANEGGGGDRTLMAIHDFLSTDVLAAVGTGPFGPGAEYIAGGGLVPGNWYFLAATFTISGATTDIHTYVADLTAGSGLIDKGIVTEPAGNYNTSATSLWAGGPWFALPFFLDGAIDELAIFDGALGTATIQSHLTALDGTQPIVIGDFNGDGNVTTADFDIMKMFWLTDNNGTGWAFNQNGEVTSDGLVSLADFSKFKEELFMGGASAFAAALAADATPEPSSLLLLLATAPAWLGLRRTRRRMACSSCKSRATIRPRVVS